jgi:hypothetical protein
MPGDPMVAQANLDRLKRSLQKLRERESLEVSDSEIDSLAVAPERVTK